MGTQRRGKRVIGLIREYNGTKETPSHIAKLNPTLPSPNARDSREKGKGYLLVSKRVR